MKKYQVVIFKESAWSAFIPGGGKVDPVKFSKFLNSHAEDGWRVVTLERELRRTLFFFTIEAMVVVMEKDA